MDKQIYLLKAAERALNACPRHKISHEDFKDSYEVVSAISKYLKDTDDNKCIDGSYIEFRKPSFPFLLTYELYKHEPHYSWFATKDELDEAYEEIENEYGLDVEFIDCVEIGLLRNT